MNIVFPEFNHPTIQAAITAQKSLTELPCFSDPHASSITALPAPDLATACEMVNSGTADAMIAGIDYSSRDVILACREHFVMGERPQLVPSELVQPSSTSENSAEKSVYSTFSGLAVMQKPASNGTPDQIYLLADMAACKHPTEAQLIEIIWQTYFTARTLLSGEPRIALLSFSTLGSGGRDDFITLANKIIPDLRQQGLLIDGEMQLDAAINPKIGQKKAPHSPVAGQANVLIAPDLNSGNLLYKAFEQFGGFTAAGPILQGFSHPVSDLSRGSSVADVVLTMEVMACLAQR